MSDDALGPDSLDALAAALRADSADVATLTHVLAATLPDTLPAGMVEVTRDRSIADRLAGRAGRATGLTITFPERELQLRAGDGRPVAEVRTVVRGVVIARQQLGVAEWARVLASELGDLASHDAAARAALAAILGLS